MRTLRALLHREILVLWLTPAPYISFLALLATCGYFLFRYLTSFTERFEQYSAGFLTGSEIPDIFHWVVEPYFETIAFLLVFIIPVLSGRLYAEDRASGALQLILTAPIRAFEVVLAKFLALSGTVVVFLFMLTLPLVVLLGAEDTLFLTPLCCGFLALTLLSLMYIAIGSAISQSVRNPIAVSLVHLSLLLVLYFLHSAVEIMPDGQQSVVELLSPVLRGKRILEGLITFSDLIYFLSFTLGCLIYTQNHLLRERS